MAETHMQHNPHLNISFQPKHLLISLEVNIVIKPWYKEKTKMFYMFVRPDHTNPTFSLFSY